MLILLVAVLLFNTFINTDIQEPQKVNLPEPPKFSIQSAAQHLSEAIRIKTVSQDAGFLSRQGQQPWHDLHTWLQNSYLRVHEEMTREIVPGTLTLLYTWKGSDTSLAPILIMAHQDVVPVNKGTEKEWKAPPFEGKTVDGYIYGRGAIDDKGSLVAWMEAAEALLNSNFKPKRTVIFLFGHDEEIGGRGVQAGIKLLKSRGIKPEMALDEGSIIIDKFPLTNKKAALIGVAEKSYLTVVLTATAKGGHSSMPRRNSAAVNISRAILALDQNQIPASFSESPISDMIAAARSDMPFINRVLFSNLWLTEGLIQSQMSKSPSANALIRTTTAPTMLKGSAKENVLAQRAQVIINFRIHPKDTEESVLAHIRKVTAHIPGLAVKVRARGLEGETRPPLSPLDTKGYKVLASVGSAASGDSISVPMLVLGATDARYATAITDNVYRFLPIILNTEDIGSFHGTNERISIKNVERMIKAYAQIILAMDEK